MRSNGRPIAALIRLLPQPVLDFLLRHGFSRPLVWMRTKIQKSLKDAPEGLPIVRGPLAGWLFAFDPVDGKATWMGIHEPSIQQIVLSELRPGQVALDIGAHLGYFVLLMAKAVGPQGTVIGFEPDPKNLGFLKKNIDLNNIDWATASDVALGDAPGRGDLKRGYGSGYSSVATAESGSITVSTLDEEIESGNIPRPDLILVDTEGAERPILRGGSRFLQGDSPIVIVEHHVPDPSHPHVAEGEKEALIELMAGYGFVHQEPDESHLLFRKSGDQSTT